MIDLDLFSTSQTFEGVLAENVDQRCAAICIKNAPYFAFKKHDATYGVVQGCCNAWHCPRCGIQRAKEEYGRIVNGCQILAKKNDLYFITITCKGREISVKSADQGYMEWTNRLLTTWRTFATRHNQEWVYVQVTERQKRGHPHSHIITTWEPPNLQTVKKGKWKTDNQSGKVWVEADALVSKYLERSIPRAGLGTQYDVSKVGTVEGASRYVAKYLFKPEALNTKWPDGWKRVRYSQSFPKLEERKTDAFVLMQPDDWRKLAKLASIVHVRDEIAMQIVAHHATNLIVTIK